MVSHTANQDKNINFYADKEYMKSSTLVLNKNFVATEIAEWQRVMGLVYTGAASVVDESYQTYSFAEWGDISAAMVESPNGFIHTTTLRIAIPDVIRLNKFERLPSRLMALTRHNIYEHYKFRCAYCDRRFNKELLNLDHVIPRSRGGDSTWLNLVTACIPCNTRKSNRTPDEAGMPLLIQPSRPAWRGPIGLHMPSPVKIRESWRSFVDQAYWHSELEP